MNLEAEDGGGREETIDERWDAVAPEAKMEELPCREDTSMTLEERERVA